METMQGLRHARPGVIVLISIGFVIVGDMPPSDSVAPPSMSFGSPPSVIGTRPCRHRPFPRLFNAHVGSRSTGWFSPYALGSVIDQLAALIRWTFNAIHGSSAQAPAIQR